MRQTLQMREQLRLISHYKCCLRSHLLDFIQLRPDWIRPKCRRRCSARNPSLNTQREQLSLSHGDDRSPGSPAEDRTLPNDTVVWSSMLIGESHTRMSDSKATRQSLGLWASSATLQIAVGSQPFWMLAHQQPITWEPIARKLSTNYSTI